MKQNPNQHETHDPNKPPSSARHVLYRKKSSSKNFSLKKKSKDSAQTESYKNTSKDSISRIDYKVNTTPSQSFSTLRKMHHLLTDFLNNAANQNQAGGPRLDQLSKQSKNSSKTRPFELKNQPKSGQEKQFLIRNFYQIDSPSHIEGDSLVRVEQYFNSPSVEGGGGGVVGRVYEYGRPQGADQNNPFYSHKKDSGGVGGEEVGRRRTLAPDEDPGIEFYGPVDGREGMDDYAKVGAFEAVGEEKEGSGLGRGDLKMGLEKPGGRGAMRRPNYVVGERPSPSLTCLAEGGRMGNMRFREGERGFYGGSNGAVKPLRRGYEQEKQWSPYRMEKAEKSLGSGSSSDMQLRGERVNLVYQEQTFYPIQEAQENEDPRESAIELNSNHREPSDDFRVLKDHTIPENNQNRLIQGVQDMESLSRDQEDQSPKIKIKTTPDRLEQLPGINTHLNQGKGVHPELRINPTPKTSKNQKSMIHPVNQDSSHYLAIQPNPADSSYLQKTSKNAKIHKTKNFNKRSREELQRQIDSFTTEPIHVESVPVSASKIKSTQTTPLEVIHSKLHSENIPALKNKSGEYFVSRWFTKTPFWRNQGDPQTVDHSEVVQTKFAYPEGRGGRNSSVDSNLESKEVIGAYYRPLEEGDNFVNVNDLVPDRVVRKASGDGLDTNRVPEGQFRADLGDFGHNVNSNLESKFNEVLAPESLGEGLGGLDGRGRGKKRSHELNFSSLEDQGQSGLQNLSEHFRDGRDHNDVPAPSNEAQRSPYGVHSNEETGYDEDREKLMEKKMLRDLVNSRPYSEHHEANRVVGKGYYDQNRQKVPQSPVYLNNDFETTEGSPDIQRGLNLNETLLNEGKRGQNDQNLLYENFGENEPKYRDQLDQREYQGGRRQIEQLPGPHYTPEIINFLEKGNKSIVLKKRKRGIQTPTPITPRPEASSKTPKPFHYGRQNMHQGTKTLKNLKQFSNIVVNKYDCISFDPDYYSVMNQVQAHESHQRYIEAQYSNKKIQKNEKIDFSPFGFQMDNKGVPEGAAGALRPRKKKQYFFNLLFDEVDPKFVSRRCLTPIQKRGIPGEERSKSTPSIAALQRNPLNFNLESQIRDSEFEPKMVIGMDQDYASRDETRNLSTKMSHEIQDMRSKGHKTHQNVKMADFGSKRENSFYIKPEADLTSQQETFREPSSCQDHISTMKQFSSQSRQKDSFFAKNSKKTKNIDLTKNLVPEGVVPPPLVIGESEEFHQRSQDTKNSISLQKSEISARTNSSQKRAIRGSWRRRRGNKSSYAKKECFIYSFFLFKIKKETSELFSLASKDYHRIGERVKTRLNEYLGHRELVIGSIEAQEESLDQINEALRKERVGKVQERLEGVRDRVRRGFFGGGGSDGERRFDQGWSSEGPQKDDLKGIGRDTGNDLILFNPKKRRYFLHKILLERRLKHLLQMQDTDSEDRTGGLEGEMSPCNSDKFQIFRIDQNTQIGMKYMKVELTTSKFSPIASIDSFFEKSLKTTQNPKTSKKIKFLRIHNLAEHYDDNLLTTKREFVELYSKMLLSASGSKRVTSTANELFDIAIQNKLPKWKWGSLIDVFINYKEGVLERRLGGRGGEKSQIPPQKSGQDHMTSTSSRVLSTVSRVGGLRPGEIANEAGGRMDKFEGRSQFFGARNNLTARDFNSVKQIHPNGPRIIKLEKQRGVRKSDNQIYSGKKKKLNFF